MGKDSAQAKQWLEKCYSNSDPSETTVKRLYANIKRVLQTQMMLKAQVTQIRLLFRKTQKNPQTSFGQS